METEKNWNQTPFRVQAILTVKLCYAKRDAYLHPDFYSDLGRLLQRIVDTNERWRDSPKGSQEGPWEVFARYKVGLFWSFLICPPFKDIPPSQLRAFCTYTKKFAERLSGFGIEGIETVAARVEYTLRNSAYLSPETNPATSPGSCLKQLEDLI